MNLVNTFRFTKTTRAALVGSGGKTTAMIQLARDYGSRVILTTTTHLALDQLQLVDQHITVNNVADLPTKEQELDGKILLFTGPLVETNRVKGLEEDLLNKLVELAELWECPLLIEADGARQLPIKAPADHEPPIPDFVDTVIVLVGLSGLGKQLNDKWVHRPELFSKLVDIPLGTELGSHHLVTALTSSQGGLKNIPKDARRILLINQIDSFPNWRAFHDQLDAILDHYHAIGFAVLEDQMLLELHERIAGVVLAAGGSSRFGTTKQLLDWDGVPLVKHVAGIAIKAGLNPVIVVTGADQEGVTRALKDLPVQSVHNRDWEQGQSTSVRTGIEALPQDVGAAVFLLVDQPFIPPELIVRLRKTHAVNQGPIIFPEVNGERANPVLFDRKVFQDLKSITGDSGGRALFTSHDTRAVPWDDNRIQKDIDTPEDYQALRSDWE